MSTIQTPELEGSSDNLAAGARRTRSEAAREVLIRNSMVIFMLAATAVFTVSNPRFATTSNLQTILISAAPFALIAFGQTLVILTGGIDLSVGSIISLSAMTSSWMIIEGGASMVPAVTAAIVVGLVVGAVNGFLVSVLQVQPFVATLATLTAAAGLAYAVGGGAPIAGLPTSYGALANTKILNFQLPVWIAVVGFIVLLVMMRRTAFGTRIYAVGGNPVASQIAGIKVRKVLFLVYLISGALAGLSGILLSSRVQSGAPQLGSGYELSAIAAVVIGGASLSGGRGTVWGTAVGLLLIQTLNNGLDIMLVPSYWQQVIVGGLIAIAVAVDVFATKHAR